MTMSSVLLCGSASFYRLKSVEIELKMLTFSCRPSCLTVSHFIALKQSIRKGSVCSIQNPLHHNPTAESKLRSQETHGITDHHRINVFSTLLNAIIKYTNTVTGTYTFTIYLQCSIYQHSCSIIPLLALLAIFAQQIA